MWVSSAGDSRAHLTFILYMGPRKMSYKLLCSGVATAWLLSRAGHGVCVY